ncbi:MAG: ribonuclease R [SAR86 cluster bacterium]|uniref:Ribonuclease R n=1 Tax=SAR86 cluster bacterium TaxID=2030880 RepID=A0A2A4MRD8_9GAMM|nr:MAG: ribonuclease R [SAR86 cluster bacterium]
MPKSNSNASNKPQKKSQQSRNKKKDPFAQREAENYSNPIPSREFILEHFAAIGEPISYEALCQQLALHDEDEAEGLRRRLIAMSRDGQLISNRRGVYGLVERMELVKGRVQGNKDGFGFFIPSDGSEDLFLSAREMEQVFDGDIVLARVSGLDRRGRKEGTIVEVLERRTNQVVGRYYWEKDFGVVVADNRRVAHEILIPEQHRRDAQDGQFVVAQITSMPASRRKPVAKIVEILGDNMTPGLEIEVAVRSHDIPFKWPTAIKKELAGFAKDVSEEECLHRKDLRDSAFVTIDGEDAKDFDDAVFAEALDNNCWRLTVAIADVSHYVKVNSQLDEEAVVRGNSVYFPGHVIPMLPEKLSNGLCSLKPKVDRLVMACEMEINAKGELTDYKFFEAVIYSHARLTYTEVADMFEPPTSELREKLQTKLKRKYSNVTSHLESLYGVYHALSEARRRSGALDFNTTETRIIFGETKKIKEIVPVQRNSAHRLIEECMLCANVATAKLLQASGLPVLYRIHEGPNPNKLENLREYLKEMGLVLAGGEKPEPRDYQAVLKQIEGRPDAHLLQMVLIRSLMQAVYQPENMGHFGLGYEAYTHFTSPIRRYPDLLVHRAIRHLIRSNVKNANIQRVKGAGIINKAEIYPYDLAAIESLGESCSMTERRADAAGYDVMDWLKCEYIQDRVGDEFLGTVAGVTNFGLFVELQDIYVEGLVHITELRNDYYQFDPVRHSLTGERSNKTYKLGDRVEVKVVRVNLDDKKIDLQLVGEPASANLKPRDGRGKKRGAKRSGESKRGLNNGAKENKSDSGKKARKNKAKKNKAKKKPANKKAGKGSSVVQDSTKVANTGAAKQGVSKKNKAKKPKVKNDKSAKKEPRKNLTTKKQE